MEFSFSPLPCRSRSACVVLNLQARKQKQIAINTRQDSVQTAEKRADVREIGTSGLHLALVHLRHNDMYISKGGEVQGCIWLPFPFLLRFYHPRPPPSTRMNNAFKFPRIQSHLLEQHQHQQRR